MTQEKSYDSLPNFTAADCKFRITDRRSIWRLDIIEWVIVV
jgi:hypothetical protein